MRVSAILILAVWGLVRGEHVKRSSWHGNGFIGSQPDNIQTVRGPTFGRSDGIGGNQRNPGRNYGNVGGPNGGGSAGAFRGGIGETPIGYGNDQGLVPPNRGSEISGNEARFREEGNYKFQKSEEYFKNDGRQQFRDGNDGPNYSVGENRNKEEPKQPYANYDFRIIHSNEGENDRSLQNGENIQSSNTGRFIGGVGSVNILQREEQRNGGITGGDNKEFSKGYEGPDGVRSTPSQNGGNDNYSNTGRFQGRVASGNIFNREEQRNREITGGIRVENNREFIRDYENPRGNPNIRNQNEGNGQSSNTDRFKGWVASGNILNREEQRNREITGGIRGENNREIIRDSESPRGDPSIDNQNGGNREFSNTDRYPGGVSSGNILNREEPRNREGNRELVTGNERPGGYTKIDNYGRIENIELPTFLGREAERNVNSFNTPINTGSLNDDRGFAESGNRNFGRGESISGRNFGGKKSTNFPAENGGFIDGNNSDVGTTDQWRSQEYNIGNQGGDMGRNQLRSFVDQRENKGQQFIKNEGSGFAGNRNEFRKNDGRKTSEDQGHQTGNERGLENRQHGRENIDGVATSFQHFWSPWRPSQPFL